MGAGRARFTGANPVPAGIGAIGELKRAAERPPSWHAWPKAKQDEWDRINLPHLNGEAKAEINGEDREADRLASLGTLALPAPPAPFARIINPADWEGVEVPAPKVIVPDYVPDETVTLLTGDGGRAKASSLCNWPSPWRLKKNGLAYCRRLGGDGL